MGNHNKFDRDDDQGGDTVTRKIRKLQAMGVLDKPANDPGASGGTGEIKTYPFVQTKSDGGGRFGRLFKWLKKN